MLSGTAERDGTELALSQTYTFAGTQSKILTWHGCELEIEGACDSEAVVPGGVKPGKGSSSSGGGGGGGLSPMIAYMNLHMLLASQRAAAASMPRGNPAATGPRLLVCGPPHTGRTSLVRTLTAWATKMASASPAPGQPLHHQPCVVNVDPRGGCSRCQAR